jgi:hypothetical protein
MLAANATSRRATGGLAGHRPLDADQRRGRPGGREARHRHATRRRPAGSSSATCSTPAWRRSAARRAPAPARPRAREGRALGGAALAQHPRRARESVREIVEAHWADLRPQLLHAPRLRGGRYRRGNALMADLRGGCPGAAGPRVAGSPSRLADDFAYHDPVDGSVSRNQGSASCSRAARVVFRLSGTGTSGATLRVYLERYEPDPARHDLETQAALADSSPRPRRSPASRRGPAAPSRTSSPDHLNEAGPEGPARRELHGTRRPRRRLVGAGERDRALPLRPRTGTETDRLPMARAEDGVFSVEVAGSDPARATACAPTGPGEPGLGDWFDPDKLLVDPYAVALDRAFAFDPRLAAAARGRRRHRALMPKAVVSGCRRRWRRRRRASARRPRLRAPGPRLHDPPPGRSGRTARHGRGARPPSGHRPPERLGVTAVELMPIAAWIDERHLPPLGLTNAWGYNPVAFMAPDPRLCARRHRRAARRRWRRCASGIGVILDVVYNHTGESDARGPDAVAARPRQRCLLPPRDEGRLMVNDTGTGNTLACEHPVVRRADPRCLRHFVTRAGVDGFRFDLGPTLGARAARLRSRAPLLRAIAADPCSATGC